MNPLLASRVQALQLLVFLAWRNIWRNPTRTLLTLAMLAGALAMLILYAGLLNGMSRQMVRFATEISTGHLQIHHRTFVNDNDLYARFTPEVLSNVEQTFPHLAFAPRGHGAGLASSDSGAMGVVLIGVDVAREKQVTKLDRHLARGRFLPITDPSEPLASPVPPVVLGSALAKNMGLEPGMEVIVLTQALDGSVGNELYRVAGILKPINPQWDRNALILSLEHFQKLVVLGADFHELVVRIPEVDQVSDYQRRLQSWFEPAGGVGQKIWVRTWRHLNPMVAQMIDLSRTMMIIVGVILLLIAGLGVLNTFIMAIHERAYEFGLLRAIGLNKYLLLLMVVLESVALAILACLFGSLLGVLVSDYFQTHGIDFSSRLPNGFDWGGITFEPVMEVYWSVDTVMMACAWVPVVAVVASVIPAWRVIKQKLPQVLS